MNLGLSFLDKLPVRELGLKVQSLLPSGKHNEILEEVDTSLVLYDNTLVNTANGKIEEIAATEEEHFFDAMARAGRRLQSGSDTGHVLLLLPTADFVATSYSIHVGNEKMVRSALELQSHSLIPAYEENLLLAVNAANQEGVALWFNESDTNRLFRAFEKEGLFLSAIMPRSLSLIEPENDEDKTLLINDEEGQTVSFIQIQGASLLRLLTVNRTDLEQDVFAKQWEIETDQLKGEAVKNMASLEDWQNLGKVVDAVPEYCFFPAGAIAEEKRLSFARRSKVAIAVAACLVLLLFAPFVSNALKLRELQNRFEIAQEQSQEPRSLQASIFDMEEEWGALYEYPDQGIADVLVSLNDVIQRGLTSFSINKGVVDITGAAEDPAYLVELLAEKEEFFNVGQSTNTRGGGQYGIRLNLSSVDFEAYEEKYPVISQGR